MPGEEQRLESLKATGIVDTPPEERFDRLTKEAVHYFHVPISTISLIDKDREWFKSCQGTTEREGDRSVSFCGHAMYSKYIFIVEDTLNDPRFADNPTVIGPPYIRFYAGVALRSFANQSPIGVFCIKDTKPRKMTSDEMNHLIELATEAEREINKSL